MTTNHVEFFIIWSFSMRLLSLCYGIPLSVRYTHRPLSEVVNPPASFRFNGGRRRERIVLGKIINSGMLSEENRCIFFLSAKGAFFAKKEKWRARLPFGKMGEKRMLRVFFLFFGRRSFCFCVLCTGCPENEGTFHPISNFFKQKIFLMIF